MLNIPEGDCPEGTGLPRVCSLFPTATVNRAHMEIKTPWPAAGVFISYQRCHCPFEGSRNLVHVTILQPVLWCGPRFNLGRPGRGHKNPWKLTHKFKFTSALHSAASRHKSAKYSEEVHTNISLELWDFYSAWNPATLKLHVHLREVS